MNGTTPAAPDWQAVRRDYESGRFSLRSLAAAHAVGLSALRRRRADEGWVKGLAAASSPHQQQPPPRRAGPASRRALIDRLYRIVDRNLTLMETRMASGEPATAAERERDTRALAVLARTVGQISELTADTTAADVPHGSAAPGSSDDSEADRLRLELAQRLLELWGRPGSR